MADNMIRTMKVLGTDITLSNPMPEADVKQNFFAMVREMAPDLYKNQVENKVLSFRTEGETFVAFRDDAVFG